MFFMTLATFRTRGNKIILREKLSHFSKHLFLYELFTFVRTLSLYTNLQKDGDFFPTGAIALI